MTAPSRLAARESPPILGGMSDEKEAGSGGHSGNNTPIFAALAANLGIAVTKIIAWLLTGMSS
ncbi:MAG: cation transporter, partial [Dermacoccus nishinomiyaensis]